MDGKLSIECYLSALDRCYQVFCQKEEARGRTTSLDDFDYFCFHAPYCKLVQKSLARLQLHDFLRAGEEKSAEKFPHLQEYRSVKLEETYFHRPLEQALMKNSQDAFLSKTQPTLTLANLIGNMYTPSLYGGLISLLINKEAATLAGKRIGMFSYGSGLASSMFSLELSNDDGLLERLVERLSDVAPRLERRIRVPAADFVDILKRNEETHHKAPYQPVSAVEDLQPASFYLAAVDAMHRRSYARRTTGGS